MFVKNQSTDRQIFYNDLTASEKLHKTYDEIVKSRRVVKEVRNRLQLIDLQSLGNNQKYILLELPALNIPLFASELITSLISSGQSI